MLNLYFLKKQQIKTDCLFIHQRSGIRTKSSFYPRVRESWVKSVSLPAKQADLTVKYNLRIFFSNRYEIYLNPKQWKSSREQAMSMSHVYTMFPITECKKETSPQNIYAIYLFRRRSVTSHKQIPSPLPYQQRELRNGWVFPFITVNGQAMRILYKRSKRSKMTNTFLPQIW